MKDEPRGLFRRGGRWYGTWKGHKTALEKWAGRPVLSQSDAMLALEEFKAVIRGKLAEGFDRKAVQRSLRQGKVLAAVVTFDVLAERFQSDYVQARLKDKRPHQIESAKQFFGTRPVPAIAAADIEEFLAFIQKSRKVAGPTINRYRALLSRMFSWAVERNYLERSPFTRPTIRASLVRREKEHDPRDRVLSDDELANLFNAMNQDLRRMAVVAARTGIARGQMLSLTWEDLTAKPGMIRLRGETSKTGRRNYIPIHPDVAVVFEQLRGTGKSETARVFPVISFRTAWDNARRRAGVRNFRWHDWRHQFATDLNRQGVQAGVIRKLLGHRSLETTQRYITVDEDTLTKAVTKLPSFTPNLVESGTEGGTPCESTESSFRTSDVSGTRPSTSPNPGP